MVDKLESFTPQDQKRFNRHIDTLKSNIILKLLPDLIYLIVKELKKQALENSSTEVRVNSLDTNTLIKLIEQLVKKFFEEQNIPLDKTTTEQIEDILSKTTQELNDLISTQVFRNLSPQIKKILNYFLVNGISGVNSSPSKLPEVDSMIYNDVLHVYKRLAMVIIFPRIEKRGEDGSYETADLSIFYSRVDEEQQTPIEFTVDQIINLLNNNPNLNELNFRIIIYFQPRDIDKPINLIDKKLITEGYFNGYNRIIPFYVIYFKLIIERNELGSLEKVISGEQQTCTQTYPTALQLTET